METIKSTTARQIEVPSYIFKFTPEELKEILIRHIKSETAYDADIPSYKFDASNSNLTSNTNQFTLVCVP